MKRIAWFTAVLMALSLPLSAQALNKKLTKRRYMDARHCLDLGVIDGIVPEPEGGAHVDHDEAARLLGEALDGALEELIGTPADDLRRRRRARFRSLGVFA